MSSVLRNKPGNISKVKYFLPNYQSKEENSAPLNTTNPRVQKESGKKRTSVINQNAKISASENDVSF